MEEREFTETVYLNLLGAFGDFSRAACNELNEMMYFVARVAERCGMESVYGLRRYFENNQIEGLPSSQDRFICIVSTEEEKTLAGTLEFHLERYISSLRVGNKHFALISGQPPIQISTNDYDEIINRIQMANGNVHEAASRYLSALKEPTTTFIDPMASLMNDCLEPIDHYLQVVLNQARNALFQFISGVSGCLSEAREHSEEYSGEQQIYRVRWSINGEKI